MSVNEQVVCCYHGTTRENGEKIKKERCFMESNRKNEWLGKGAYFFASKEDALWWVEHARFVGKEMEVLECRLKYDDGNCLNLDNEETYEQMVSFLTKRMGRSCVDVRWLKSAQQQERQCYFCNALQKYIPTISVRSFTFPANFSRNDPYDFGFHTRKQICVVNQSIIKEINGELWR